MISIYYNFNNFCFSLHPNFNTLLDNILIYLKIVPLTYSNVLFLLQRRSNKLKFISYEINIFIIINYHYGANWSCSIRLVPVRVALHFLCSGPDEM